MKRTWLCHRQQTIFQFRLYWAPSYFFQSCVSYWHLCILMIHGTWFMHCCTQVKCSWEARSWLCTVWMCHLKKRKRIFWRFFFSSTGMLNCKTTGSGESILRLCVDSHQTRRIGGKKTTQISIHVGNEWQILYDFSFGINSRSLLINSIPFITQFSCSGFLLTSLKSRIFSCTPWVCIQAVSCVMFWITLTQNRGDSECQSPGWKPWHSVELCERAAENRHGPSEARGSDTNGFQWFHARALGRPKSQCSSFLFSGGGGGVGKDKAQVLCFTLGGYAKLWSICFGFWAKSGQSDKTSYCTELVIGTCIECNTSDPLQVAVSTCFASTWGKKKRNLWLESQWHGVAYRNNNSKKKTVRAWQRCEHRPLCT